MIHLANSQIPVKWTFSSSYAQLIIQSLTSKIACNHAAIKIPSFYHEFLPVHQNVK